MNTKLPYPIEVYFRAANAHNSKMLADCFAENAIVYDEGKEYRGQAAIREWNETTSRKYELTLEVVSVALENGETVVTAMASGNFEGSPAAIEFHFVVENQKVTSLRCE